MADAGYVNEGTDRRARGLIGALLASVQRGESFKSALPPRLVGHTTTARFLWLRKVEVWEFRSVPKSLPFYVVFYYRADGTVDTYRFGHRYDENWGDANVEGYNPDPGIIGGYIYDVILKLRRTPEQAAEIRRSFGQ